MAEIFATLKDLETRWQKVDTEQVDRANALLEDASLMVAQELDAKGIKQTPPAAKMVVCEMVKRVLSADINASPYTQQTQQAGPYSMSYTFNTGGASLYISKAERRALGLTRLRIGSVPMGGGACLGQ